MVSRFHSKRSKNILGRVLQKCFNLLSSISICFIKILFLYLAKHLSNGFSVTVLYNFNHGTYVALVIGTTLFDISNIWSINKSYRDVGIIQWWSKATLYHNLHWTKSLAFVLYSFIEKKGLKNLLIRFIATSCIELR
jgi:hypothetical protein